MTKAYRIKDWDEYFENAQSRRYRSLSWVAFPNKHDGKGLRRIARHAKGAEVLAAWMLMVQVASKMEVRGLLVDKDGPLRAEDLGDKTGFGEEIFTLAFEVLSGPRIGWIEEVDWTE